MPERRWRDRLRAVLQPTELKAVASRRTNWQRSILATVIGALLDAGGQIMLGTVKPISDAAVAHDGKKTLAMLRRQAAETVPDLLARLDAAIAAAQSTGSRVDEINEPNSDV
jgi:hypothetical protein